MLAKQIIFLYYAESHPYIHQFIPSPFLIKGQTSVGLMCLNVDTSKKFYGPLLSKSAYSLFQPDVYCFFHTKNKSKDRMRIQKGEEDDNK